MKTKVITVATRKNEGLNKLLKSFKKFNPNDDIEILGMDSTWKGFGTKIILTKEYLKTLEGYTHFIFVDAYDVLFFDHVDYINERYEKFYNGEIVFSAEKNCWPDFNLIEKYPGTPSPWKYLNSGSYIAPIDKYLTMVEKYEVNYWDDDQRYFTNIFLNEGWITLDNKCNIFQAYSFLSNEDFTYTKKYLINNFTGTIPIVIHGNGKTDMSLVERILEEEKVEIPSMNSIEEVKAIWRETPEYNRLVNEIFEDKVNQISELKEHRDFVEKNIFGFGERSFLYLWYLIVKEMPQEFVFLEIGVFRGAILSAIKVITDIQGKDVKRYGVTPLSSAEIGWESDYEADIERIHDEFKTSKDYTIIKGDSTSRETIKKVKDIQLDILYIDGCHTEECATSDIINYAPLLKVGGYLVIDDSACKFPMPFGYFTGIQTVCDAVDKLLPPFTENEQFEHLFNVMHNRVWKKIK